MSEPVLIARWETVKHPAPEVNPMPDLPEPTRYQWASWLELCSIEADDKLSGIERYGLLHAATHMLSDKCTRWAARVDHPDAAEIERLRKRVRDAAEKGRALYGPNPTSGDTAEGLLRAMTAHWDRERAVMANLSDVAGAISTSERLGREYGELMKRVYTYLERSALEPQDAA